MSRKQSNAQRSRSATLAPSRDAGGELAKPWGHLRTGFGLIAFGVALLLVPVVAATVGLYDSVVLGRGLDSTVRLLLRNLALIAGVAGLGMAFLGLALSFTLRRDHPGQKRLRGPLELAFGLAVGGVLMVAGTSVLVRWFFTPETPQAVGLLSGFGLLGGALLGLAAVWGLLVAASRVALLAEQPRLRRASRWMRVAAVVLAGNVLGVAVAEGLDFGRNLSVALVTVMYLFTLAGGIWLSWTCARLRSHVGAAAAEAERDRPRASPEAGSGGST